MSLETRILTGKGKTRVVAPVQGDRLFISNAAEYWVRTSHDNRGSLSDDSGNHYDCLGSARHMSPELLLNDYKEAFLRAQEEYRALQQNPC